MILITSLSVERRGSRKDERREKALELLYHQYSGSLDVLFRSKKAQITKLLEKQFECLQHAPRALDCIK